MTNSRKTEPQDSSSDSLETVSFTIDLSSREISLSIQQLLMTRICSCTKNFIGNCLKLWKKPKSILSFIKDLKFKLRTVSSCTIHNFVIRKSSRLTSVNFISEIRIMPLLERGLHILRRKWTFTVSCTKSPKLKLLSAKGKNSINLLLIKLKTLNSELPAQLF